MKNCDPLTTFTFPSYCVFDDTPYLPPATPPGRLVYVPNETRFNKEIDEHIVEKVVDGATKGNYD